MTNTQISVSIRGALSPERIIFLEENSKRDALVRLVDLLATSNSVASRDDLSEGIFHREELMSTGIGLGIGVPHVRLESVSEPTMAVGVAKDGLPDYESIDGETVKIVFMIAAGETQHAEHLALLSSISRLCREDSFRNSLLAAGSPSEIYDLLTGGK